jgi:hypothetical protein
MPVVASGFAIWSIGAGLKCLFGRETQIWLVITVLLVEGCGVGLTLQPSEWNNLLPAVDGINLPLANFLSSDA